MAKKYFWLKLKKDFFKRHDVMVIESMANGKDYVLFYLKLLVESVDHEGRLRFNNTIPYNETMLATITNTNVDIVRSAMKLFVELKLVEILSDETIYMAEVENMLGTESYWAEQKRKQRNIEGNLIQEIGQCPQNVQSMSNVSNQELDIELDKDKESDKEHDEPAKEKKIKFADYVTLTEREHELLIDRVGQEGTDRCIEILDNYKGANGKKYKSDYRAILNWVVDRYTEEKRCRHVKQQNDVPRGIQELQEYKARIMAERGID